VWYHPILIGNIWLYYTVDLQLKFEEKDCCAEHLWSGEAEGEGGRLIGMALS